MDGKLYYRAVGVVSQWLFGRCTCSILFSAMFIFFVLRMCIFLDTRRLRIHGILTPGNPPMIPNDCCLPRILTPNRSPHRIIRTRLGSGFITQRSATDSPCLIRFPQRSYHYRSTSLAILGTK